ncbi:MULTISPECIES: hypothetical protein [unclassified Sphingomonas]|uniref:hypothetical protein n=1 Tax=unclassified Sphingomonas TaxID=196159 RepID=UPI0026B4E0AD
MLRACILGLISFAATGCDGTTPIAAPTGASLPAQPVSTDSVDEADRITCAIAPASALTRTCIVETAQDADGQLLTIRHPDGGFRRLRVTTDGRGVIAADGAEVAIVKLVSDYEIEVAIGGDRYMLPATTSGKRKSVP